MRTSTIIVLFGCIIAASFASYAVKKNPTFKFDAKALETETSEKRVSFGDLVTLFQTHDFQDNTQLHQFLDKLRERITNEHHEHLGIYNAQRESCKTEVEFREEEIKEAEDSQAAAQAHHDLCFSERSEAQSNKEAAEAAITVYEKQLEDLRYNRRLQRQIYEQRDANLEKALNAIDVAIGYLRELEYEADQYGLATLIQMTNTLLSASVVTGQTQKVLPLYNKLLQVHARGNYNAADVNQVEDLLNQIRANVVASQQRLDQEEEDNRIAFEKAQAALEALLDKLRTQVSLSVEYIGKMDFCITQENDIIAIAADKFTRNTDLLVHAHRICEDNENEWRQAEEARKHQADLLDQLQWALDQLAGEYQEALLKDADNIDEIIGAPAL